MSRYDCTIGFLIHFYTMLGIFNVIFRYVIKIAATSGLQHP